MFGPEIRERLKARDATVPAAPKAKVSGDSQHVSRGADWKQRSRPLGLLVDDVAAAAVVGLSVVFAALGRWWVACLLALLTWLLVRRVLPPQRCPVGLRVVCISDTHGRHRDLELPEGDVLIHAGDFTKFGRIEDVTDFNDWLGSLPFQHKIVVNGNHESNADWWSKAAELLSNATFLKNSGTKVNGLQVYGADFCWPMRTESPLYALIPKGTDIVIAHGPAKGFVDGGGGCRALLWAMQRVRPRLVVSGHIHEAHGVRGGFGALRGTTFVNAANCRNGYSIGWGALRINL